MAKTPEERIETVNELEKSGSYSKPAAEQRREQLQRQAAEAKLQKPTRR